MRTRLVKDSRGTTAVEFALAAPVFLGMVIGVSQLGQLYFANAGIQHSVEQAARVAAVYPTPPQSEILAALNASRFGMKGNITPVLTEGESDDGMKVLDISLSYSVPLDFVFFHTPPVTLNHSRRVFVQEELAASGDDEEGGSGTGSGTGSGSGTGTGSGGTGTGTGGGTTDPPGNGNNGNKKKNK